MTYDDIRTQFTGLLNRRDMTTAQRDGFIQSAVQRVQRKLRAPALEKAVLVTIDSTYSTTGGLVIPSDLIELIDLIPQGQGEVRRLEKVDITRALQLATAATGNTALQVGFPQAYSRQGGLWVIGPAPAVGDVIRINYYAELSPLVNGTDTNVVTIITPDLIYYGALAYAGDYFNDKRAPNWEARFAQILEDLNEQGQQDEENGASSVQPAYDYPDELGELY